MTEVKPKVKKSKTPVLVKLDQDYVTAIKNELKRVNWSQTAAVKFGLDQWLAASNPNVARKLGLIK